MKKELQERLFTQFPWTRSDQSDRESPWTLFGFEVGDGWFQLLWDLLTEIEEVYRKQGFEVKLEIGQIKEKFGVLRFYIFDGLPEVYELVEKQQNLSKDVCYDCGGKAYLQRYGGWWTTMCDECLENRIKRAKENLEGRDM